MELLDKDGNVIGSGTTDNTCHDYTDKTYSEVMSAKAYDNAEVPNVATSQPKKQLIQLRNTALDTDLDGKAGTQTPVEVTTDPNTC